MDNIAKALIMAGGVLVGMMLLAIMVLYFNSGGRYNQEFDSTYTDQQLADFNAKYEAFERKNLTYFDIITVANMAWDNNENYGWDSTSGIDVYVDGNVVVGKTSPSEKNTFLSNGKSFYDNEVVKEYYDSSTPPKLKEYSVSLGYSNVTGKVNRITFTKN